MKTMDGLCLVSCALLLTQNAQAYLDPATGSFLLQMIVAGITGFILFFRIYYSKIKKIWSDRFGQSKKEEISHPD